MRRANLEFVPLPMKISPVDDYRKGTQLGVHWDKTLLESGLKELELGAVELEVL